MRKGFVLCILTFLFFTLLLECAFYGERLIAEFRYTEKVETLAISEISTYDPNDRDGIFLTFRYRDTESGNEYACSPLFTSDRSYQIGDPVTVVTRNGCPKSLLCDTKRKKQRTAAERAADVGYDTGMILHIIITVLLLLAFWLPNRKMIPAECRKRKRFVRINTTVYALIIAAAAAFWIAAEQNHNSWDGLGYACMSILLYIGGSLELLISWMISSVILKKWERTKMYG